MMEERTPQHVMEDIAPVVQQAPAYREPEPARESYREEPARAEFVPAVEHRPAPVPVAESRPEPVAVAAPPKPAPAPAWRMDPVSLPSDMVMIETQNKAAPAYQESEESRPARSPRQRNRPAPVADEPMQQVETGGPSSGGSNTGG
jgi:hypothetical protein